MNLELHPGYFSCIVPTIIGEILYVHGGRRLPFRELLEFCPLNPHGSVTGAVELHPMRVKPEQIPVPLPVHCLAVTASASMLIASFQSVILLSLPSSSDV